jgi:hypothetical protein
MRSRTRVLTFKCSIFVANDFRGEPEKLIFNFAVRGEQPTNRSHFAF